jgi:hypothetical protein
MISDGFSWSPVAATAVLMYLAKASHIAVLHYNLFLISILVWCAFLIAFYRIFNRTGTQNGGTKTSKRS